MAVPVNVYVEDDSATPAPIEGAVVGAFDPTTFQQVGMGSTDADGRASLLLPGGTYELRFFKAGFLFAMPQTAVVNEPELPEAPNGFTVAATPVGVFGVPLDPRVCRCIGRFINFRNQPVANAMVRISAESELLLRAPKVVDSAMVSSSAVELRTDANGFVSVDLLRTGKYWITYSGEEDELWTIVVPDRSTANLIELIHPEPTALTFGLPSPVAVTIGQFVEVPVEVAFSDFQTHSADLGNLIQFDASDSLLADVSFRTSDGVLVILGKATGTFEITASIRPDLYPLRLPTYNIGTPTLTVNVS